MSSSSILKFSVHKTGSNLCCKKVHNGGHNVLWIGVSSVSGMLLFIELLY